MREANGETAPEGAGNRRRRVMVAVAGTVVVALVVAGAVVFAARDGDETTTATSTTTTTAGRPSTTRTTTTRASTTATTATTTTATTTTTEPASTSPLPQGGGAGPGCANGWSVPAPGTALRIEPLDLIRRDMGIAGQFLVTEMRYFIGPEVPWILRPRPPFVEWWYVKAQLVDDPAFRARWLVVRRSAAVKGVTAVARFDTEGYRSPDWRAFIGDSPPHTVEGVPGTWVGMEFDFTVGEDGEKPGLPDEVVHCLDGT